MPVAKRRNTAADDPRSQPAYTCPEAARYLKLPVATLRSWVIGRSYLTSGGQGYFPALIHPASPKPVLLSFWNLIEAHVLRALRTDHAISVRALREALGYAEHELGIERLLLRRELCASAGELFLERYGDLMHLSRSGQLAMRQLFMEHLKRVEWDEWKFPIRLYPFISGELQVQAKPIAIDPKIAFGRPVIVRKGISTSAIAERIDAGESVEALAVDYCLDPSEIEQAVLYEHAA